MEMLILVFISGIVKVKSTTVTVTAGQSQPTTWIRTGSIRYGTGLSSTSEPGPGQVQSSVQPVNPDQDRYRAQFNL